jgi:Skp family chaperone for outer membrane proteins
MPNNVKQWGVASLAVVLVATVVAVGQSAMQAEPTAVAVVNVQQVFNNLKEKQQVEARLKQRAQKMQQQQKQKQQKIQKMRSDLDVLREGSNNYQQQKRKLERALVDFQAWKKFKQRKLEQSRGIEMQNLYRKVVNTAGSVAKDNGFDIVLYDEGGSDFNFRNSQQLSRMIQMRKVLWAKNKLNISDQVQQRMNNQFTAGNSN